MHATATARRTAPARLILADDHELARAGLRALLAGERDLEIIGEASNGQQALELCLRMRPDLALLDVRMPELDGLGATRAIKQQCPRTSVIIVTMHENPEYLLEALKAGASGYLLKDASRRELLNAIWQVLKGESFLNGALAARMVQRLASEPQRGPAQPVEQLTRREREVLQLLAQGQTNREIGQQLSISVGTVKIHVEHIIAKLEVSDRTQAAVRAVQLGLVQPQLE